MKASIVLLILTLGLGFAKPVVSQNTEIKRSNNKVSLAGKPYYIHIVRKGETLFAISQAYHVPVDSIKKDNLHLAEDIKINQYLKIRVIDAPDTVAPQFGYHTVAKGDTPFNIGKKYQISIDELYKYNPNAKMGIRIGETLKIPVLSANTPTTAPEKTEEIVKNDTSYLNHRVEKKQTKFGIAAQYKISIDELEAANPGLNARMPSVGEILRIPVLQKELLADDKYIYHKVAPKETIFGLLQQYQLKEKNLIKANPFLKERGLQVGDLLKIEKNDFTLNLVRNDNVKDSLPTSTDQPNTSAKADTLHLPGCPMVGIDSVSIYKVAFFLPLYLNINDTLGKFVDIITKDKDGNESLETIMRTGKIEDKIYPRSKIFLEFYQGALLALDELKSKGISLEVHVIDTRNDSSYMAGLMKTQDFTDFNLFIGPVFSEILTIVGDYAWEHQINIVSPLSTKSGFIDHNPYAFQVAPPFDVQMQHASDFLNEFDTKNYIVIHDGNNLDQEYISTFKKQLFAQMTEENYNQIKYNEVFYYDAQDSVLKSVFTPEIENIVIIPSSNQAFVTDVMGKLNGYSFEYNITIFGQPRWVRFDNIELDNFHNTHTHIFSNSYIDYNQAKVIKFVESYRQQFAGEPDKFAFQGYDITKYFCLALNTFGHEFRKCIHSFQTDLLQTRLNFVPYSEQGGFQNTAIFILAYTKEYQLIKAASYPTRY